MGPWRCLPMITSARLRIWSIFSCQSRCSGVPSRGLGAAEVVGLAVDEHHHVGVLLDGAGFAQVGRAAASCPRGSPPGGRAGRAAMTGTDSSLARAFRPWVIMADLLHPVVGAGPVADGDQLQIVDHDQVEARRCASAAARGRPAWRWRCRRWRRCRAAPPGSPARRRGPGRTRWRSISPLRIWSDGTPETSASRRMASCSADISREKKATTPPLTVLRVPSGCGSQA